MDSPAAGNAKKSFCIITKGTINHFDYDAFARLKNVKDWAGNIVKNYGYHTYDQVKGNAAIGLTTFTATARALMLPRASPACGPQDR